MEPQSITIGSGPRARKVAFIVEPGGPDAGSRPTIVWLGGFKSDMRGTKVQALADQARAHGRRFVRFDYFGHGESGGDFREGTISIWLADTLAVIAATCHGPVVLVGSSMGGWIALLAARSLKNIAGIVLIAPAVDFTQALMWDAFTDDIRQQLRTTGEWILPSAYTPDPLPVTLKLIEDGRNHLMLGGPIEIGAPVHILQGMLDPDVPWTHAQMLLEHLHSTDATMTLIRDGDHRLNRPQDIALLLRAVEAIDLTG